MLEKGAYFLNQQSLEKKTNEWEERYAREKETYEKEIRQLHIEIETRRKELDELKEEVARLSFQTIEFYICFPRDKFQINQIYQNY